MGALLLASQQFLKWLKERLQSSCNLPNILGGKLSLGFIGHAQSSSRRSRSRDIDRTSFRRNAFKRDSGFFTLISTGRGVWIRMEVPSHSHAMRAIRSAVDSSPNSHSSTRYEGWGKTSAIGEQLDPGRPAWPSGTPRLLRQASSPTVHSLANRPLPSKR